MKNLFLKLILLVLTISFNVLAVARTNTIYQDISYCKLRYADTSGKNTQFNITLFDNNNNSKLFVVWVSIGSLSRVEGMHKVPLYSTTLQDYTCYFYDTDNYKWSNPSGYVEFRFTGRYSGSDPIYYVHFQLRGYYGSRSSYNGTCEFAKEIPVKMTDVNNNPIEIKNDITVVNIPGCDSHVSAKDEGYFNYIGQSEQYLFRFETLSVSDDEGRFLGLGTNVDDDYTYNQLLPNGSNKQTGDASCDVTLYNGYYFFEGYFNYNNTCFYVTMQYPNYQADNNPYTQSFDFESATITRRADFETSGVVTLTATNEDNKKVVLDFVVDKDAVGNTGEIIIPAGDYTVSTSEEQGTIIASGGINYDLSIKNSYAGTTTALNATNYSTNPLWCLRTGVVTVEEGMSTITVTANQNYRNAPVNITIKKAAASTHTLTFYGEGLTGNVQQTELNEGDAVTAPVLPERADNNGTYTFSGWYCDNEQTVVTDFDGVTMPAQNLTYRATWTLTSYDNKCIDSEGNDYDATAIMMYEERWQLDGTDIFFDDHNSTYEDYDYAGEYIENANPTLPLADNFTDTYVFTDPLRSTDANGTQFDSIVYKLEMTYSRFFNNHKPDNFSPETSRLDERIDLGIIYLDDDTDSYTNDGQTYTLANLEGKNDSTFSLKIASGTYLHGCDSVVKFTITQSPLLTWETDGGNLTDGDYTDGRTKPETPIVAPADPTKDGYTFNGWNTAEDGTGSNYSADATMPATDLTYYAQWTVGTRTITWVTDGDALTGSYTNGEVMIGSTITEPDTPTRTGYTFAGWYPAPAETMPDNDLIYTATWTAPTEYATGCLDPEGYTNEGSYDWYIDGFADHNVRYENFDYVLRDTTYRDTLRSADNTFDSIYYSLNLTYGTMYKKYNRFITLANGSQSTTNVDFRVDLGTFYLDDESDSYSNDGQTFTLANLEGKNDSTFSLKIASGTALHGCDSVVKFTLTQSPLLTWNATGGNLTDGDYTNGRTKPTTAIVAPADPTRDGYTFNGWNTAADGTGNPYTADDVMPTTDLTYYAQWTAIEYTITYNELNGATNSNPTTYTIETDDITFVSPGERDGYTFCGWKNEAGETVTGIPTGSTGDTIIIAQWTLNTYKLTFYGEGLTNGVEQTTLVPGTAITAPTLPGRSDNNGTYVFVGWYSDKTQSIITDFDGMTMPEEDITFRATWTLTSYDNKCIDSEGNDYDATSIMMFTERWQLEGTDIFFDDHNSNYEDYDYVADYIADVNPTTPLAADFKDTYIFTDALTATDRNGLQFDSIVYRLEMTYSRFFNSHKPNNFAPESSRMDERIDLGTFYLNDESDSYSNDGQTFTLANLEGKNDSTFSLKIASGTALHGCDSVVKFTLTQSPLLTWNATGGNLTDGDYTNGRTKPTTAIVAPADPTRDGYTFNGWNTAADGTGNPYTADDVMPTTDLTYYAQWTAIEYTITYNELNGATNSNPTTYTIETDDITFVSPGERDGYTFCGWKNEAGETVTGIPTGSTGDTIIIAQWTLNTYKLTFYGEGLTNGVEQTTLVPGTAITAPTLPERIGTDAAGNEFTYTFNGWYPTLTEGAVMPENDVTYYATWSVPTVYVNTCVDSDGEQEYEDYYWEIPGWDEHNDNYDPSNGFMFDRTEPLYTDILRSSDNSFDSITYTLSMTYTRMYKRYMRFGMTGSTWVDDRTDLGTIYLDDESDKVTIDDQDYTLADIASAGTDGYIEKYITGGTVGFGCDSVVKFVLTQSPLLTWDTDGGNLTDGDYTDGRTKPNTAIVAPADPTRNGYTFNGWNTTEDGTGNPYSADNIMPTTDLTYYAQWNAIEYTITYDNLYGTTHTNQTTYTIETADIVLIAPSERDGYVFTCWTDESGTTVTTIATGTTGNITLTANWEEALPQDVLLYDNWSEEEYAELFDKYRGKVINVIFKRTFKANEWTTITLPFAIDFEDYPDFDGNIFELSNATTDETDGFVLYFSPVDGIETACVPYLFRPTTNIVEPRFENVQFESFDKMVVLCSSGDVEFHSTTYLDRITNRTSLYISNNRLYYANQTTGTRMRAFRGYFELLHPEKMEYVQPRFRLPGMAKPIEITEGTEDADETTDTAIKYIQDDRLVIELNGIRYNAIGNKIR